MIKFLEERLDSYLNILREMVSINSWTGNAAGIDQLAAYTAKLFASKGFSAERIRAEHGPGEHLLLSRSGKGISTVAFISHLDTVYSPEEEAAENFIYQQEGDRIFGPGTNDIKGGTLLIYMLIDAFQKKNPHLFEKVSWLVLLDATEETRSDDFGLLCRDRIPTDARACLVFEAGDFSEDSFKIVTARKGRGVFRLTATGRGGHAGVDHHGAVSAIDHLSEAITKIHYFTDYSRGLTFNTGTIRGGSGLNRIAEYAEAEIEMRAFDPAAFGHGRELILSLPETCSIDGAAGSAGSTLVVEEIRSVPSWPVNDGTKHLFDVYCRAAGELGFFVEEEQRGGLSDGNLIWDHVPVLDGLGPSGKFSHRSRGDKTDPGAREYLYLPSLVPKTLLNLRALEMILAI